MAQTNQFADSDGFVSAHCADNITGEYLGPQDVWVSAGTGLPAGAYIDPPPPAAGGQAVVRTATGWRLVPDYRGQTAYDKSDRQPLEVAELGPLPDTHTLLAPSSPSDIWTGTAWERDAAAEQQAKLETAQGEQAQRLAVANQQIAIIKPAVDGGYAHPAHTQLLADWQRYRYQLTLVPEQLGWPESPQWPDQPTTII